MCEHNMVNLYLESKARILQKISAGQSLNLLQIWCKLFFLTVAQSWVKNIKKTPQATVDSILISP